jgi:methionyl-tRNA formyltransferase
MKKIAFYIMNSKWFYVFKNFIDWSWNVEKIKRFVDAVGCSYNNTKAYLNGEIVKFIDVEIV